MLLSLVLLSHPCSRLQEATQRRLRSKSRQETHMVGPGPQQPPSVHSSSQVRFCCSLREAEKDFLIPPLSLDTEVNSTHIQKLTTDTGGRIVPHVDGLVTGSEEAGPLFASIVAELDIVPQDDPPSAHLLQGAQTQPAEVLRFHHCQTVLTREKRFQFEVQHFGLATLIRNIWHMCVIRAVSWLSDLRAVNT